MIEPPTTSASAALIAWALERVADGQTLEAISELSEANRKQADPALERALVQLRIDAWQPTDRAERKRLEDPPVADLFAGESGIPEVAGADLDATVVRSAIQHHGALVVRGLLPAKWCSRLRDGIDRSWEAIARYRATKEFDPAWFDPLLVGSGYGRDMASRVWGLVLGTAYVADSPRLFFELLEAFDEIGMKQIVAEYLGEPPLLSLAKTAQRRLPSDASGGWHQDAAVYGMTAYALDCWIPMSRCGDVAPGLDLWPRRLDHVADTVGPGATEFGTRPDVVEVLTSEVPPVSPVFDPGDAAIFDELTLHQTSSKPEFTEPRYGFESWFFTPSAFPDPELRVPIVY